MPGNRYSIILFRTIHDVLRAEKTLKKQDVKHELVPVPRNLSSDCGMCIRLDTDEVDARQYLENMGVEKCFVFDGETYEQVDLGI
ncbi:MAG: DUF3343 domain-containing protein [Syntrophorhabdus sp.]|nr:DUF3343 domain-containing protein [Syntrophorhabdus sp.]